MRRIRPVDALLPFRVRQLGGSNRTMFPLWDVAIAPVLHAIRARRVVEIASLLALAARVLCRDEPTAGLAQRETEKFGPLLLAIREELSASMIIIEHDMPLIMAMSDRVYCLELGVVIAEGTPSAVRDDPLVIASYLGTDERAIQRSDHASDRGPGTVSAEATGAARASQ
jgi:ABC-type sugar transport system ATPase subunit